MRQKKPVPRLCSLPLAEGEGEGPGAWLPAAAPRVPCPPQSLAPARLLIAIHGLSFAYRRAALYDHFDLRLAEPGVYGVFGRNGSGKSTLLKLLAGLLFPRRGRIEVAGFEPRRRHPDFLAQVYLVPEEFHLPNLTAAQLARSQSVFYPRFSAASFAEYLREFEVPEGDTFESMSLGQKKKAAVAFALATFTPVLLLDEPTNGLDPLARDQFKRLVSRPEQKDRLILISTHQAHDLERIMDHILFLDAARVALSASREQLERGLTMGVAADANALAAVPDVIYDEELGTHRAFVAANRGSDRGTLHMELLYKALSRNHAGVIAALAPEAAHV
jgi:ABC-2 type transport system ATP-binding protein